MKVLIFEDNLIWSSRLVKSVRSLGHEPLILTKILSESMAGDVAIVNLGSESMPVDELLPVLRNLNIPSIGHAGHKEKGLLDHGREAGCTIIASNSELTFKLEGLLAQIDERKKSPAQTQN